MIGRHSLVRNALVVAVAGASVTACKRGNTSGPGDLYSLASRDASSILFALAGLSDDDLAHFADAAGGSRDGAALDAAQPYCFVVLEKLTPRLFDLVRKSGGAFENLPDEIRRGHARALRPFAIDAHQARALLLSAGRDLRLPEEAIEAVLSPDLVEARSIGVTKAQYEGLVRALGDRDVPPSPHGFDRSVSCDPGKLSGEAQTANVALAPAPEEFGVTPEVASLPGNGALALAPGLPSSISRGFTQWVKARLPRSLLSEPGAILPRFARRAQTVVPETAAAARVETATLEDQVVNATKKCAIHPSSPLPFCRGTQWGQMARERFGWFQKHMGNPPITSQTARGWALGPDGTAVRGAGRNGFFASPQEVEQYKALLARNKGAGIPMQKFKPGDRISLDPSFGRQHDGKKGWYLYLLDADGNIYVTPNIAGLKGAGSEEFKHAFMHQWIKDATGKDIAVRMGGEFMHEPSTGKWILNGASGRFGHGAANFGGVNRKLDDVKALYGWLSSTDAIDSSKFRVCLASGPC